MKVIELLNKIANGELENGTKFRDKYTQKEYVFKPNSYAGIYPPDTSKSDEDWLLTLHSGWFRLDQEVEIIEEDKKIVMLENEKCYYDYATYDSYKDKIDKTLYLIRAINLLETKIDIMNDKTNEIIKVINEMREDK